MNEKFFLILLSETEGKGGLFDIGFTLPFVMLQFVILMSVLNIILYQPLNTIIKSRENYIEKNLGLASEILVTVGQLTTQYENNLAITKKESKYELIELQKLQKQKFERQQKRKNEMVEQHLCMKELKSNLSTGI